MTASCCRNYLHLMFLRNGLAIFCFVMSNTFTVVEIGGTTTLVDRARQQGDITERVDELWSTFARTTLVVCKPDTAQLQCPPRMHIRPLRTTVLTEEQFVHLTPNHNVSPHCFRKDTSRFVKDSKQLNDLLHKCQMVEEQEIIQQMCEGRNMCHVSLDQLFGQNMTECSNLNFLVKLEYKCLPDPDSASFEAICADTYMEVKCDRQIKGNTLVILTARLEKQINSHLSNPTHSNGCPPLQFEQNVGSTCSSRIDVTKHIQAACDGRPSCSVSPSMSDTTVELPHTCGKMHLGLTYVCVPSDVIVSSKRDEDLTDSDVESRASGKGKKNQRQPKGVYNPKVLATRGQKGTSRSDETSLRDTRQLEHSLISDSVKHLKAFVPTSLKKSSNFPESKSTNLLSANHSSNSLQPLFIALGVGVLILVLAVACVIAACRRKTSSTAIRKHQLRVAHAVQHNCGQTDPHWTKPTQTTTANALSRLGRMAPCPGCRAHNGQNLHSPTAVYDSNYSETCRCSSAVSGALETACGGIVGGTAAVELQESFHPCCNPVSTDSNRSPQNRVTIPGYGLPGMKFASEHYPVSGSDAHYLIGLHQPDLTKCLLAYNDQHSMSQSNSSSSGVGMNSAHLTVYGSPYPMGPVLASPTQPGNRVDTIAYSTGYKESPVAESSSGRGCDGGSGTSEPSETFHFTCPRTKPGFHPNTNPLATRSGVDYLPIPGQFFSINASEYVNGVSEHQGNASPFDATSGQSLAFTTNRPSRSDMSPRPSFRSSTSTECNFAKPSGFMAKTGEELATRLDYVMEKPSLRETYDHVGGYRLTESELCNQLTLNRRSNQRDWYALMPPAARDSAGETQQPTTMQQGSIESLTVPLLEPPSNFRSPIKMLNTSANQDYIGLDAEDNLSSQLGHQNPPDVMIKNRVNSIPNTDNICDDTEQPPPPIAPLRVFSNSSNLIGLNNDQCYFNVR